MPSKEMNPRHSPSNSGWLAVPSSLARFAKETKLQNSILLAFIWAIFCAGQAGADDDLPAASRENAKWKLVWSDEFEGEALDDKTWSRCRRATSDWNNTMSQDPSLLKIDGGVLHLRGIKNE